jgi:hypothetical protein
MISKILQFTLLFASLSGASIQASFASICCRSNTFRSICGNIISIDINSSREDQNRLREPLEVAIRRRINNDECFNTLVQVATDMRYNGPFASDQAEERQAAIRDTVRQQYPHLTEALILTVVTDIDYLLASRDPRNRAQ